MCKILLIFLLFFISCSNTQYFYIVRHAEKEGGAAMQMMSADPALSPEGERRAIALREKLKDRKISHIYSTGYQRTRATVRPLAEALGLPVTIYDPTYPDPVDSLKMIRTGNVLIVAHSNTVDDLVNSFLGKKLLKDLPDNQYGDLFVVKRRKNQFTLEQERFGD